jgi:hypothetical protein
MFGVPWKYRWEFDTPLPGTAALQVIFIKSSYCLCKRGWGRDILIRIGLTDAHRSITVVRVDTARSSSWMWRHRRAQQRAWWRSTSPCGCTTRMKNAEVVAANGTEHTHRIERRMWPHAAVVDKRCITFFSPTLHPQPNYLLGAGKRAWGVEVLNSHSLTLLNSHYREPINKYSVSCSSNSHSLVRTPPNQTRRRGSSTKSHMYKKLSSPLSIPKKKVPLWACIKL